MFDMRIVRIHFAIWLLLALAPSAFALDDEERARASSLFATYREAMAANHREVATEAIRSIISGLPREASVLARQQILAESEALATAFAEEVNKTLARHDIRMALRDPDVVRLRATITGLLAIRDDDELKKRLAEDGWPAMEKLTAILLPDPRRQIESDATLAARRDAISFRLDLCDSLGRHAGLPEETEIRSRLTPSASSRVDLMPLASLGDRRTLAANQKILATGEVPAAEAIGIEDANRIRVLAGLPALRIDPVLCMAARVHSQDMVERGFFDHQSPVEGRWSFSDRAAWAGTTASAENISQGQTSAAEANRGWFLSPGHFRNFMGNHARIGLGIHETHYTQLFGD
jgi:uncharacterized protein YkwD